MLDKLNAIADEIEKLLSTHPDAKAKKAKQADPDGDGDEHPAQNSEAAGQSAAARAQKSIRNSMGGPKEPGC